MTTPSQAHVELTLYVNGASQRSARAIANTTLLCQRHLSGRYELAVVDLREQTLGPQDRHVLATPTLVRNRPLPVRRHVGDLADGARVFESLDLPLAGDTEDALR